MESFLVSFIKIRCKREIDMCRHFPGTHFSSVRRGLARRVSCRGYGVGDCTHHFRTLHVDKALFQQNLDFCIGIQCLYGMCNPRGASAA